jgi:ADP-dependent NAD(P)H-hydrate dehydratase / NAD(P)H-hydrate epimerase
MKIVTGAEMRRIDEATISRFVTGVALMERAGQRVFEQIESTFPALDSVCVSIFLGRGNNAGDGLVVARLLAERGARVILHYLRPPEEFSPDAAKNHARLASLDGAKIVEVFLNLSGWQELARKALEDSDLIVDALLGTGLNKAVGEDYAAVIDVINGSDLPIVAVDMPSGVNADTGEIMGAAVAADATVTMGLPKIGCLFYPGKGCAGELVVGDIGVPAEVIDEQGIRCEALDLARAVEDLPLREPTAHKFACGSLLVVAGSRRYAGAAILAAVSALRTGCGVVYCAGPESIRTVVQGAAPEVIFVALPETAAGSLAAAGALKLLDEIRYDALAIGPGLTTEPDTAKVVRSMLDRCPKPMLIDADGLNALEGRFADVVRASKVKEIVITPHAGELKRLVGESAPELPVPRLEWLRELVRDTGVTVVHKGAPTVAVNPDGSAGVCVSGHPGQATAGSGDVLSGAIAGFLAQGAGAARAARLGVYLHSRAAEIAALDTGERGMIAGDCMRALSAALKELE